jgi:hypothetical protein
MRKFLVTAVEDENGAVTVDWVVLTAAVVGLAFLAYGEVENNIDTTLTATGDAVLVAQDYLEN